MSHPPGLLRARCKRPRRPCASNQRDERTASFHTSLVVDAAYRRTGKRDTRSHWPWPPPLLSRPPEFIRSRQNTPIVMKLATATLNDGQHEWLRLFAAAIGKKSGGRIEAKLYPASQLGSIPRMIEGTQFGSIQLFIAPPEFFVGVGQRFELLSAAGLAESQQHAIRIISDPEFAKAFPAIGTNKGREPVCEGSGSVCDARAVRHTRISQK
jgi:hypothetical protein